MSEYATESELTSGLAAKQDVISDLATIRSGASAGATAVQPAALNDYATTTALTEGLAAKQDTISDLSAIRSGAQAGSTAVQPAALNDYATTSALTSGLAAKQDTISDLSTIRSGAAAGATAVQPSSLATVATTGAYSDLSGTPTIPTVDQTYDGTSTNAQSGVAVASAISELPTIPDWSTASQGDVLTVGIGEIYWGGVPVDQTYDASSSFAQSGTAVAGAISTKQDVISDLSTIRSGATAGATAVQPGSLATVATSGSYNDLSNKPDIPATKPVVAGANVTITEGANDITISATNTTYSAGNGLSLANGTFAIDSTVVATQSDLASYTPTASLATVATTGSYVDLINKPSIPVVVTVEV